MKFSCDLSGNAIPRPSTFRSFVRTRSRCAESAVTPEAREPSDAGVRAPEALPKTSSALPKIPAAKGGGNTVTENTSPVTEIIPPVTEKKRGRPPKPDALTAAEKQRRYRERHRLRRQDCSA